MKKRSTVGKLGAEHVQLLHQKAQPAGFWARWSGWQIVWQPEHSNSWHVEYEHQKAQGAAPGRKGEGGGEDGGEGGDGGDGGLHVVPTSMYPVLHDAQTAVASVVHAVPVAPTPLVHVHTLARQVCTLSGFAAPVPSVLKYILPLVASVAPAAAPDASQSMWQALGSVPEVTARPLEVWPIAVSPKA